MRSTDRSETGLARRLIRFAVGLALLAAVFAFFASGYTPPGMAGEVLRHNQAHDIDASPLFYTEVEHMSALEDSVAALRYRQKLR